MAGEKWRKTGRTDDMMDIVRAAHAEGYDEALKFLELHEELQEVIHYETATNCASEPRSRKKAFRTSWASPVILQRKGVQYASATPIPPPTKWAAAPLILSSGGVQIDKETKKNL